MERKWLPSMPLPVATVAVVVDTFGLSAEDEGYVLRCLRRSWACRRLVERLDGMSDSAWVAAGVVWKEIDALRAAHEDAYDKRASMARAAATARWKRTDASRHADRIADRTADRTADAMPTALNNINSNSNSIEPDVVPPIVTPPVTATPSQEVTSPRAGAREQRETWLTPFGQAWERATNGQFAYSRSSRPLKRLVDRHGAEAVFRAWCSYLSETETQFLSVDRFAGTYGHWAGTIPEAVARGHDPNRAAVERVRLKLLAKRAGAAGVAS